MKLKYQAKKGSRIKYRFMGVQIEREPGSTMYWYVERIHKWSNDPPWDEEGISNTAPCKSVRAFRRKMKKWKKELPSGIYFRLISRWVGYDVNAKT